MEDQKRINIVEQQSDHCQSEKEAYDFFTMKHNLPGSQKSADYPFQTKKG